MVDLFIFWPLLVVGVLLTGERARSPGYGLACVVVASVGGSLALNPYQKVQNTAKDSKRLMTGPHPPIIKQPGRAADQITDQRPEPGRSHLGRWALPFRYASHRQESTRKGLYLFGWLAPWLLIQARRTARGCR